jgi:outer membrane protein assembly factor BamA
MVALLLAASLTLHVSFAQTTGEVVADIKVHGNHTTPDADVIALSGLAIGQPLTTSTIADATERLRKAKKFDDVSVLKRFASIDDPTRVLVVIVVNEGPARLDVPNDPSLPIRVVKRRGFRNLMYLPIFDAEDGYGVTYGVRLALVNVGSREGRITFPLSWGGLKQAGAAYDRRFGGGPLTRVEVGGVLDRQRNPAFGEDLDRHRIWLRGERAFDALKFGATSSYERVTFAGASDTIRSIGGDVRVDTRLDPLLPRNAVDMTASVERLTFGAGTSTVRTHLDATGYLGVYRQIVLVAGASRDASDAPLPLYLKPLLGGWSTLRGFEAGSFVGDTMARGTIELRVPVSSVLSQAKLGVSLFADTGKAYDYGRRFRDVKAETGVGASVWITVTAFRVSLAVAHGLGADTRVNFGAGFAF